MQESKQQYKSISEQNVRMPLIKNARKKASKKQVWLQSTKQANCTNAC